MFATAQDICSECGKDWSSRYGRHNCNFHRIPVHTNSLVIEPRAELLESVRRLTERLYRETCSSAESADLSGYESPYPSVLADIDATIGMLKGFRRDVQSLGGHCHDWNDSDYCSICGADGRA